MRERGGGVLSLPTGYGKTTVALHVASQLAVKTLVVVHMDFLTRQWAERVEQCLPGAKVSYVQGGSMDLSGDVVVAMIQTLVKREYPPAFDDFGLLIVDECHIVGAEVFSSAMFGLAIPLTLGLSATPHRKDGLSRVIHWFLGPIAHRVERTGQADVAVRFVKYWHPRFAQPPPQNRRGELCFTSLVGCLARDDERTELVAGLAAQLARAGRHVLVLSQLRDHCKDIAARLVERGEDAATFLGGQKTVPENRVLVATYSLAATGLDVPRLDALVLATPKSDVHQASGRILRKASSGAAGAEGPVIVDLVDGWGVCYAQRAKRRAFYRRCGFAIADADGLPDAEPEPEPAAFEFE